MLETTAPIAVFRTGQGTPRWGGRGQVRAGVGGGGDGGLGQVGGTAGRGVPWRGGGGYHGGGGGGGVGARDPRAHIGNTLRPKYILFDP